MLLDHTIAELGTLLSSRKISSRELVEEAYDSIEKHNKTLSAFITVREKEGALRDADASDASTARGPLSGIPFCLKDAYVTKDLKTTAGSKVLDTFIPPYSATVVQRLLKAGAILIGKNNMDAWGHGSTSENTDYGPVKNPWDVACVAGGSSGGSAVAIATRMSAFAVGEDTGGSIRAPASMCNIAGLKVTYGRVSRYGSIAYASSLDTVGPMAKSASDLALVLEAIAGKDVLDATSSRREVPAYSTLLKKPLAGTRIGIPKEFLAEGLDSEVRRVFDEAVKTFTSLGARIIPVSIPSLSYAVAIYYLIATSETSSNLNRYDGVRFGNGRECFTEETMRRIVVGTYALKAGYHDELYTRATKGRTLLIREFDALWNSCDMLLGPTMPEPPYKLGTLTEDPVKMYLADIFTVPVNLTGLPSLALPAGFSKGGLPIGIQLIGKKFDEQTILAAGEAYGQATDWHKQKPPITDNPLLNN